MKINLINNALMFTSFTSGYLWCQKPNIIVLIFFQTILPIMNEYAEVETCVEVRLCNASDITSSFVQKI